MGPWNDDLVQFARLLCEIRATTEVNEAQLLEEMDLDEEDLEELFDRAHVVWENAKHRAFNKATKKVTT